MSEDGEERKMRQDEERSVELEEIEFRKLLQMIFSD